MAGKWQNYCDIKWTEQYNKNGLKMHDVKGRHHTIPWNTISQSHSRPSSSTCIVSLKTNWILLFHIWRNLFTLTSLTGLIFIIMMITNNSIFTNNKSWFCFRFTFIIIKLHQIEFPGKMVCIWKLFNFFLYLKRIENGASFVWFHNYYYMCVKAEMLNINNTVKKVHFLSLNAIWIVVRLYFHLNLNNLTATTGIFL